MAKVMPTNPKANDGKFLYVVGSGTMGIPFDSLPIANEVGKN